MTHDKTEAPFIHVEDDEPAPFGGVWADYHPREHSFSTRLKKMGQRLKKLSDPLDDWCHQSVLHYFLVLILFALTIMVALGVYAHLFLL